MRTALLLFALGLGCDGGSDSGSKEPVAEDFVGTWRLGLGVTEGCSSEVLEGYLEIMSGSDVDLLAYNSQENATSFAETGPLTINFVTGQAGTQNVPLHWNVGSVQVGWAPYANQSDYNGDIRQSCASAGIADLVLGFHSTVGDQNFALGSACNASVILDNVYSGALTPYIDACGPGGTPGLCGFQGGALPIYREDPSLVNPTTITVQPGVFFQAANPTPFQVFIPLFPIP